MTKPLSILTAILLSSTHSGISHLIFCTRGSLVRLIFSSLKDGTFARISKFPSDQLKNSIYSLAPTEGAVATKEVASASTKANERIKLRNVQRPILLHRLYPDTMTK
jgi:hypothetical protein